MASMHPIEDKELQAKLQRFYPPFLQMFRKVCLENNINPRVAIFGMPHDSVVAVDKTRIIILAGKGTATDSGSTDRFMDLTDKSPVEIPRLQEEVSRLLGLSNTAVLVYDRALLDRPEGDHEIEFRADALGLIRNLQDRVRQIESLGIKEAMTYLENAKQRFNAGNPEGYSDCKANCRNALISLCKTLGGTERIRDAIPKMGKAGLIGEREGEVILALTDLAAKLHGQASKKGTHPPLAERDEAQFTLKVTDALIELITSSAMRSKGLT